MHAPPKTKDCMYRDTPETSDERDIDAELVSESTLESSSDGPSLSLFPELLVCFRLCLKERYCIRSSKQHLKIQYELTFPYYHNYQLREVPYESIVL